MDVVHGQAAQSGVPAAFFLHFDPTCHQGKAAVDKHVEYFRSTGMDISKVQFELAFPSVMIQTSTDWQAVPSLPVSHYAPQLEVVKGIVDAIGSEALVVCTLYSPFMVLNRMAGAPTVIEWMKREPHTVAAALHKVRDSLMGFVRASKETGLDGFYHSTQGGENRRLAAGGLFEGWIKPVDLEVMSEIDRTFGFNILHVCDYHREEYGGYNDLRVFEDYPGTVANCHPVLGLKETAKLFSRPFMGGLDRLGKLATGTEAEVRTVAREALADAPQQFLLGADCTVPPGTPWSNLAAAIDEAHSWSR